MIFACILNTLGKNTSFLPNVQPKNLSKTFFSLLGNIAKSLYFCPIIYHSHNKPMIF